MTLKEERGLQVLINERRQQLYDFVKDNNLTIDPRTIDMNVDDMVDITVFGKNENGDDMEIYVGIDYDGNEISGLSNLTEEERVFQSE